MQEKHHCQVPEEYMGAVFLCFEDNENNLVVSNEEYSSIVNYCPFCGYRTKKEDLSYSWVSILNMLVFSIATKVG